MSWPATRLVKSRACLSRSFNNIRRTSQTHLSQRRENCWCRDSKLFKKKTKSYNSWSKWKMRRRRNSSTRDNKFWRLKKKTWSKIWMSWINWKSSSALWRRQKAKTRLNESKRLQLLWMWSLQNKIKKISCQYQTCRHLESKKALLQRTNQEACQRATTTQDSNSRGIQLTKSASPTAATGWSNKIECPNSITRSR